MEEYNYFSKILAELMKEHGLTQLALAQALDIQQSTVHGWLVDERKPCYDLIQRLSDYFNVSADMLCGTKFDS